MIHSMRWFGPNDPVPLDALRQAGCTGVVTALHQIPVGEIWTVGAIQERIQLIEADNAYLSTLHWVVVESLPVHESIKKGLPERDLLIQNYIRSLENLAACNVRTVCYNFMPILDWSRTNVSYELPDGARTLRFDWKDFAVFDLFILKRIGAEQTYSALEVEELSERFKAMSVHQIQQLTDTVLLGLPGSEEAFELTALQSLLNGYAHLTEEDFRENLYYFVRQVAPVAEQLGMRLCIHPDDPPRSLLGLHRIVSSDSDLEQLFSACPSLANGVTFCTGSLGAGTHNNLQALAERWKERIYFAHLRATQREEDPLNFHEAEHLKGDVDMYSIVKILVEEEARRRVSGSLFNNIPMRPDHGFQMLDDMNKRTYPGYSAIGRLKGLAELRGLEWGIKRSLNLIEK